MRPAIAATILSISLLLLEGCTMSQATRDAAPPPTVPPKIAVPVGKNWQVIEEAPNLTNELHQNRLPFQGEQSVQPPGSPPASATEKRKYVAPPETQAIPSAPAPAPTAPPETSQ